MKHYLPFFILLSWVSISTLPAQKPAFEKDGDFQLSDCPTRWRESSMVMLCMKHEYDFRSIGKTKETIRRRFILNDQDAISRYSELYFTKDDKVELFIVKENGSKVEVNMKNARETKNPPNDDVIFTLSKEAEPIFIKIKLPKMKPGEIIDVTYRESFDFKNVYDQTILSLVENFPVVKRKISFRMAKIQAGIQRYVVMKFKALNGAKPLKMIDDGEYLFVDENREAYRYESWGIAARSWPMVKYNAYWNLVGAEYLLDPGSRITSKLDKSRFLNQLRSAQLTSPQPDLIYQTYLQKSGKRLTGMEAFLDHYYFRRYLMEDNQQASLNDLVDWFGITLKESGLAVDLMVIIPRSVGTQSRDAVSG